MPKDKSNNFEPLLGKSGSPSRKAPRTTVSRILRAFAEQGGDPRRMGLPSARKPSGRFNARGRGRDAAAALEGHGGWEMEPGTEWSPGMRFRARRVVVKARVVKLKGVGSQAISSHLRYLQREGVTPDGQHGSAYSSFEDQADAKAFAERGLEDRHQFRFIVAAEDGVELGALMPHTRRLMRQMEQDLGTTLDWIAVDHYNTGHPHTHVVVRGVTDDNKILYIAGNYISHGIRARASDLVTRELGRQSEWDVQQKLGREIDKDRFTRLDRTLLDQASDGLVDLRVAPAQDYLVRANRHLLLARLGKLEKMELAKPREPGVWELSPRLEPALKQLGERSDTFALMRTALGEEAVHRAPTTLMIHRDLPRSPVTGQLAGKGLAGDGLGDKAYLVIDGVDARVHYIEVLATDIPEHARIGAILTIGRAPSARFVDKTIAQLAARNDGFYDPRRHLEIARETERIPGGDFEGHVEGHVRRLEALRRAGIVERFDANQWDVPQNFLERAAAYDEREGKKLALDVESTVPLDRQVTADAATWLDRQLVGRHPVVMTPRHFGHKVEAALLRRNEHLIAQGLARRRDDGTVQYRPDLLATLQHREVDRVGRQLAAERTDGFVYVPATDGANVRGIYRRAIILQSGKFAEIERGGNFTLVPWRSIIEAHRGREVVGIVRGIGVSWQFGWQRDRGLSR